MSDRLTLFAAYRVSLPVRNLLGQTVESGMRYRF
jgi:hypothetical protein